MPRAARSATGTRYLRPTTLNAGASNAKAVADMPHSARQLGASQPRSSTNLPIGGLRKA